jgi:hypothetical protein
MEGLTMLAQHDPKRMARVLREQLKSRAIDLKHSECLEIVAAQLDARDWNTLVGSQSVAATRTLQLPTGWLVSNQDRDKYEYGLDPSASYRGKPVMIIRHRDQYSHSNNVGGLLQGFDAEDYRGKRVALNAWLKGQDVAGSGTIWMRAEGNRGRLLVLDNMELRAANGALRGIGRRSARLVPLVLDIRPLSGELSHESGICYYRYLCHKRGTNQHRSCRKQLFGLWPNLRNRLSK